MPFLFRPDESTLIETSLKFGTGDFNPHFFDWPALIIMYLLFVLYGSCYLIFKIFGIVHSSMDFSLMYWNDPTIFFLIARSLTALVSTGTIYVIYKIGSDVYTKKEGTIAALFLAVSYYYVAFNFVGSKCVVFQTVFYGMESN